MREIRKGDTAFNVICVLLLVIIGICSVYPIWYVLIASVSNPIEIARGNVTIFPRGLNFEAYEKLFGNRLIWIGYKNSILYVGGNCIVSLLLMTPCAYALSKKDLPARKIFSTIFIITMYFSGGLIPTYVVINKLGMVNTPWVMIVTGCVSAYNMILMKNYFSSTIPEALWDSARIDGSSHTGFFTRIVVPLSKPIIAIIALFSVTTHWNAYLAAQMYLYKKELFTLQQVIKSITANVNTALMEDATADEISKVLMEKSLLKYSVVVVGCLPLVIAYPFVQKFFVSGIMVGSVKE